MGRYGSCLLKCLVFELGDGEGSADVILWPFIYGQPNFIEVIIGVVLMGSIGEHGNRKRLAIPLQEFKNLLMLIFSAQLQCGLLHEVIVHSIRSLGILQPRWEIFTIIFEFLPVDTSSIIPEFLELQLGIICRQELLLYGDHDGLVDITIRTYFTSVREVTSQVIIVLSSEDEPVGIHVYTLPLQKKMSALCG